MNKIRRTVLVVFAAALMIAIRTVCLNADPPNWLSWSAGIFTDEGIYALDSRSMALLGHWCPGNFHSAIASPPLYGLQLIVFRVFGAGLEQARVISVVLGLGSVPLIWVTLRNLGQKSAANIAALLLGFMPLFALYNRLALMETPASFCLCAAFAAVSWLFAEPDEKALDEGDNKDRKKRLFKKIACIKIAALFIVLAVAFKSLCWLIAPAFVIGVCRKNRLNGVALLGFIAIFYALFWGFGLRPYLADLSRMNAYYLHHQYLPHSLTELWANIKRAIITGDSDGCLPTILKLTCGCFVFAIGRAKQNDHKKWKIGEISAIWILFPVLFFIFSCYSPSRYDVLIAPPIACLTALWIDRFDQKQRFIRTAGALILFGIVDLMAVIRPAYSTVLAQNELKQALPQGSVIMGQFAPQLAMGSSFQAIYVQPGLANDRHPENQQLAEAALVTRSQYWDNWWRSQNPSFFSPSKIKQTFRVGQKYDIDLYSLKR